MSASTVSEILARHGVSRLCHFTPSRNLSHIATDGYLRPTRDLADDVRAVYNPTDLSRFDGHPELICCSLQYPNPYYFAVARQNNATRLFADWVVLLLDPDLCNASQTLYCTGNASRNRGRGAQLGAAGLSALYAPSVAGSSGTYNRTPTHMSCCPTDLQAEVLIPGPVDVDDILGVVVSSAAQAATETVRLRQLGSSSALSLPADRVRWVVAPTFFRKAELVAAIHSGRRPAELEWSAPAVST